MIKYARYKIGIFHLQIGYDDADDTVVSLEREDCGGDAANEIESADTGARCPLTDLVAAELREYLRGDGREFTFPYKLCGTPFQLAVWNALREIPYGETRSYAQIAAAVGRPRASRAVGAANHRNPIFIAIPCHRVIGADGSLVGYGGGLEMKSYLLELEKKNSPGIK